jgi:hypothetical protein
MGEIKDIACPKCQTDMVYVDMGPRLQYHYCRTCKMELNELEQLRIETIEDDYSPWGNLGPF